MGCNAWSGGICYDCERIEKTVPHSCVRCGSISLKTHKVPGTGNAFLMTPGSFVCNDEVKCKERWEKKKGKS